MRNHTKQFQGFELVAVYDARPTSPIGKGYRKIGFHRCFCVAFALGREREFSLPPSGSALHNTLAQVAHVVRYGLATRCWHGMLPPCVPRAVRALSISTGASFLRRIRVLSGSLPIRPCSAFF